MIATDVIDLAELAAFARPIRHELAQTRRDVSRSLWIATNGETKAERIQARKDLRRAGLTDDEMTEQEREYFGEIVRAAIAKAKADETGGAR